MWRAIIWNLSIKGLLRMEVISLRVILKAWNIRYYPSQTCFCYVCVILHFNMFYIDIYCQHLSFLFTHKWRRKKYFFIDYLPLLWIFIEMVTSHFLINICSTTAFFISEIIDDITDHTDTTTQRLLRETRHIKIVDKKSNTCGEYCCI